MKRIVIVCMLAVVLCLTLAGCNQPEAVQYSVQFDSNGGSEVSSVSVEENSLLTKPTDPTRDGYKFIGWFVDSQFEKQWMFDVDKVQSDMTLFAKWEEVKVETFTVTFDSCGGSYVAALRNVPKYSKIAEPIYPTLYGFKFMGWFVDSEYNTAWDFASDAVSSDMILYAKWVRNENVASKLVEWSDPATIMNDWLPVGNVVLHSEGACLEVEREGAISMLRNRIIVPDNRTYFTFSVRKFVRETTQDKDPQVYLKVNGTIIKPEGMQEDFISPTSDAYVSGLYNLESYSGQEVVVEIYSTVGEHAAINTMMLCGGASDRLIPTLPLYMYDIEALEAYEPSDFNKTQIFDEWKHSGSVVLLPEGTSLSVHKENPLGSTPESAIYAKFDIDNSRRYLHISARTFFGQNLGEDGNGYPPEMMVYVVDADGNISLIGTKLIDSEAELTLHIDLADYIGQEITIIIGSGRGGHCAISYIELNTKGGGLTE